MQCKHGPYTIINICLRVHMQVEQMNHKNDRLKLMNEILAGIKVCGLFEVDELNYLVRRSKKCTALMIIT